MIGPANPFIWLLFTVIDLYIWVVLIHVVLSWLMAFGVVNSSNQFVYMIASFTYRLTEPALGPIRRVVHSIIPGLGGVDVSPVVLILLLLFAERLILWALV